MLMAIGEGVIHPKFRLNGKSYTFATLKRFAFVLLKEGRPFEKSIGIFLSDWLDETATVEVKTSGSTGVPKIILLKKQQMINSALATGKYFSLTSGKSALLCLSADYIAGKMMLVRAMILGLALDYVEPSSSPLNESNGSYDFAAMVPLQLENSLKKIEQIKTLIVGGAPMSTTLKAQVQDSATAVFETYGMTETITHVAVRNVNSNTMKKTFSALLNVTFSIDGRDCLIVDAPDVNDITVITNDIVRLISETEFEWLGRYDNVINSGGVKLIPEQIENKLASQLANRFFVAGLPDEKLGQKLVLIVEGKIDSYELEKALGENTNLTTYEVPKNIYQLQKFVETATGKIRREENLRLVRK